MNDYYRRMLADMDRSCNGINTAIGRWLERRERNGVAGGR